MDSIKRNYPEGTRIKLNSMLQEDMPSGLKGTVKYVDDIGQIHMKWDNGRTLALIHSEDDFEKISE